MMKKAKFPWPNAKFWFSIGIAYLVLFQFITVASAKYVVRTEIEGDRRPPRLSGRRDFSAVGKDRPSPRRGTGRKDSAE